MIVLGKDKTLDNYFIDENGVITDQFGNVQKIYFHHGRPHFKGVKVYQIQMWTNYGYRDVNFWVIHHKDEDLSNSSLTNLTYITRSEHTIFHQKGNKNLLGYHHSKEAKQKIGKAIKMFHWYNDGVKNYFCESCPDGCIPGRKKEKNHLIFDEEFKLKK